MEETKKRLIVGISGASGVLMGYRLLQELKKQGTYEIHLVITHGAALNFRVETDLGEDAVRALADAAYDVDDLSAAIASGSFPTEGMIVLPCSMKTLAGVANGFSENLLLRAADVCLKEGRKVVLVPREMPLSRIHLKNMLSAAEAGCVIVPPVLTFYEKADDLSRQMDFVIGKVLSQFGIRTDGAASWDGYQK